MSSSTFEAARNDNGSRPKVLLIDDDPLMRRTVAQSLDKADVELVEAESGPSGVEEALRARPAQILLDVIMPGMDGFEVLLHLRRHPLLQGIPVIMLTALGEMSQKINGMQSGADDYITKPFDPRELRARIHAHLKRSSQYLQASPLTSLPGNPAIQQVLFARIAGHEPMAVLYLDLDNFKAYNDVYGWLAGDQILRELGDIIVKVVLEQGDKDDFVGHVGGDDFVVVTRPARAEAIANAIIQKFDAEIPAHYADGDRERGFIETPDRQGVIHRYPFASLSVAIVTNEFREIYHPLQVAQLAAEVKRFLKSMPGSQYGFDRRRK